MNHETVAMDISVGYLYNIYFDLSTDRETPLPKESVFSLYVYDLITPDEHYELIKESCNA